MAAPAWTVLSGRFEHMMLYLGIENLVLGVKWVSEIRAISILFSLSVGKHGNNSKLLQTNNSLP